MSVLLWLLLPLVVIAVISGVRRRSDRHRARPEPRELVRRALVVLPSPADQRAQLRTISRVLDTDPRLDVLIVETGHGGAGGVDELSPRVTVLRRPDVVSRTAALQAGAARGLAGGYDAVVELPVRHPRLDRRLTALLEALDDGAHVAVGSRYTPGGRVIGGSYRHRALSRGGNAALRWVARVPVSDVTTGVRAYRREAVEEALLPASGVGRVLGIDVALRCRDAGLRITEVPVTVTGPVGGRVTAAGGRDLLAHAVRPRRRGEPPASTVLDLTGSAAGA